MQSYLLSRQILIIVHILLFPTPLCVEITDDDDETVAMIKELLDTRIRFRGRGWLL